MKVNNLNHKMRRLGKSIILIGVFVLFLKVRGFYGFGGYVDNAFEILIVSLIIISIGIAILVRYTGD